MNPRKKQGLKKVKEDWGKRKPETKGKSEEKKQEGRIKSGPEGKEGREWKRGEAV